MPHSSTAQGWPSGTHAALPGGDGELRPALRLVIEALIRALLRHLFPHLTQAEAEALLEAPRFDPRAVADMRRLFGCAPHTAAIALGLAPSWVLVGPAPRGMRAAAPPPRPDSVPQPARPPPRASPLSEPEITLPPEGENACPICSVYVIT